MDGVFEWLGGLSDEWWLSAAKLLMTIVVVVGFGFIVWGVSYGWRMRAMRQKFDYRWRQLLHDERRMRRRTKELDDYERTLIYRQAKLDQVCKMQGSKLDAMARRLKVARDRGADIADDAGEILAMQHELGANAPSADCVPQVSFTVEQIERRRERRK